MMAMTFISPAARGLGGWLCSNTYHLLQHLLYWDAPGHVPGPLPSFALPPPGPLQPPCFYFTISIPMKFTLSTQVEQENEKGGPLKCILKSPPPPNLRSASFPCPEVNALTILQTLILTTLNIRVKVSTGS